MRLLISVSHPLSNPILALCLSVSLSLYLFVTLSLCLDVPLPHCLSVSLCLCFIVSLSLCLSIHVALCRSVSPFLCLCLSASLPLSNFISILSLSLLCHRACLPREGAPFPRLLFFGIGATKPHAPTRNSTLAYKLAEEGEELSENGIRRL